MRSFLTFLFLTAASIIVLQLLIAFQTKLVIERLDALERYVRPACECPIDERARPQREPWPEVL